jgi:hypothetical protein
VDRTWIEERGGLALEWPGVKLGVEICHLFGEHEHAGAQRWRAGLILEPHELKAWASALLNSLPDLSDRFPWTSQNVSDVAGHVCDGMPRGPLSLGEAQAMAALIWLLHPVHDQTDAESIERVGRGLASQEVIQMPSLSMNETDSVSGNYFRVGFRFFRLSNIAVDEQPDPAVGAVAAMFGAMVRMGCMPEGSTVLENVNMPPSWDPKRSGHGDMEQLASFADLWGQIEIGLASFQSQPRPTSVPRATL